MKNSEECGYEDLWLLWSYRWNMTKHTVTLQVAPALTLTGPNPASYNTNGFNYAPCSSQVVWYRQRCGSDEAPEVRSTLKCRPLIWQQCMLAQRWSTVNLCALQIANCMCITHVDLPLLGSPCIMNQSHYTVEEVAEDHGKGVARVVELCYWLEATNYASSI